MREFIKDFILALLALLLFTLPGSAMIVLPIIGNSYLGPIGMCLGLFGSAVVFALTAVIFSRVFS